MDVFPPADVEIGTPDWGFSDNPEANVNVITLGDGYVSREPIGLNHITNTYSPNWSSLDPVEAGKAYEFLFPRLKWKPFKWVHPVTQVQLQVTVEAVSLTYDEFNNAVLAATFKTDHNPE